jgi:serine/threonine-protein kinase
MTLDTGEIVEERYRVVKLLGQGGMGAVYRAWDTRLNRPVALKEMTPQSGLDSDLLAQLRQQFQQEAQVLATLVHPGLVRVTDYFSWGGNEYLVMDFVEGESLAQRIQREGAQPEAKVLAWGKQLLDALAYCHQRGVIHRDIKPQNIVITPEDGAVLVDFGLVKLWNPRDPRTRTVMRGAGTPEYAPPEQYDIGMGHTDSRSDIYSLGATIYHALTGQAPPTATQRMASPASFLSPRHINATVSQTTEAAVLKAMGMAMDQRFQGAEEMAQALGLGSRPPLVAPAYVERGEALPAAGAVQPVKAKRGTLLGLGSMGLVAIGLLCLVLTAGAVLAGLFFRRGDRGGGITPTTVSEVEATLFQDDFSSPTSGWEVGEYEMGSVGYKDGVYSVVALGDSATMWGVANVSFEDVVIEVAAVPVSAPANNNNDYGIICRNQPGGLDGYYLLVSGDGGYAILKAEGGEFGALVDWTASASVNKGSTRNYLRAICEGEHLALYVNGELLAEADDATFSRGDIAFTATSYEDEPTEVHFDNMVVHSP